MTIARVQGPFRGTTTINTIPVTMASVPQAGNVLIAVIGTYSTYALEATVNSITQNNVAWTKIASYYEGVGPFGVEIWAGVVSANASASLNVNLAHNATFGGIVDVAEYSGILTSGFLDQTALNHGWSATTDTGTIAATSQADELWIGAVTCGYNQTTPTNGFTLHDGVMESTQNKCSVAFLEKLASAIGSANSGTAQVTGTYAWVGVIVAFKASTEPPVNPSWTLNISPTAGGSTSPSAGYSYSVAYNTSVSVSATASDGYKFDGWTLDGSSVSTNPVLIGPYTDGSTHTLVANFSVVTTPPPSGTPFGKLTQGANYRYTDGSWKFGSKYNNPTAGTFTAMFARLQNIPGWALSAPLLRTGIIDMSGNILAMSNTIELPALPAGTPITPQLYEFTLPQPVTLPDGDYWLVVWIGGYGGIDYWMDWGATTVGFRMAEDFDNPVGTIPPSGDASWSGMLYDIYVGSAGPRLPIASFSVQPPVATVGATVSFDASASQGGWDGTQETTITSCVWDFGDGTSDTGVTTTHTYAAQGIYIVKLIVTDSAGQIGTPMTQALSVIASGGATLQYATGFENATRNTRGWYLNLDPDPKYSFPLSNFINGDGHQWIQGIETPPAPLPENFIAAGLRPGSNRCLGLYFLPGSTDQDRSNVSLWTQRTANTDNETGTTNPQPNITGDEFYLTEWLFIPSFTLISPTDQWYGILQISNTMANGNSFPYYQFEILGSPHYPAGTFAAVLDWRDGNSVQHYIQAYPNFQNVLPIGRWFQLKWYMLRHKTNGIIKCWIDDIQIFNASGLDTSTPDNFGSSATPNGSYTIDCARIYTGESSGEHWLFVDDIRIYNTLTTPSQPLLLNITAGIGGNVSPSGQVSIEENSDIQVTAVPDPSYILDHWELDGAPVESTNPLTVHMGTADRTLNAIFVYVTPPPEKQTLTIIALPNGTTTPTPESYTLDQGTQFEVTAIPNSGYQLQYWLLDGATYSTEPTVTVTMDTDHTLTAVFIQTMANLTISVNDPLMGTTSPAPNTYDVLIGTIQQVTAIPATGYMFDHWELNGVNVGATSSYSVTMDKDHAILAVFIEKPPPPPGKQHLTISTTTGGTTTPTGGVWEYDRGTSAQVTATANTGYIFKQWILDNNPMTPVQLTITVLMDADHAIVAVFEPVPTTPTRWTWPFLTWLRNLIRQRQV